MKDNINIKIIGEGITLIPYRKEHVKKYHLWMQDEELLEATASEKLTLEEEYENQISWANDDKKCTFIIIDNEINDMIGDINFFWNDNNNDLSKGEINMMIAEKDRRRKGLGYESLKLFIIYLITYFNVKIFIAKIGYNNRPSINLFKKLGFKEMSHSDIFEEFTYKLENISYFKNLTSDLKIRNYK